uniref:Uncharacterized protein n=1 Tax=Parascaris equorum TaxID=6256 RepID=A0A914RAX5_PAREQ
MPNGNGFTISNDFSVYNCLCDDIRKACHCNICTPRWAMGDEKVLMGLFPGRSVDELLAVLGGSSQ